jgi:hypothetical protein
MNEDYYSILVNSVEVARHVTLGYAGLFMKAIMQEYWKDDTIEVTIRREPDIRTQEATPDKEDK